MRGWGNEVEGGEVGVEGWRGRGRKKCRSGQKLFFFFYVKIYLICSLPVLPITAHTLAHTMHLHDHDVSFWHCVAALAGDMRIVFSS